MATFKASKLIRQAASRLRMGFYEPVPPFLSLCVDYVDQGVLGVWDLITATTDLSPEEEEELRLTVQRAYSALREPLNGLSMDKWLESKRLIAQYSWYRDPEIFNRVQAHSRKWALMVAEEFEAKGD